MQFLLFNGVYRATRITGPTHNLLGLEFGDVGDEGVVMEALPLGSNPPASRFDPVRLREAVLEGVAGANEELATSYEVRRIQYVRDDTPRMDTYKMMAAAIVERLAQRLEFERRDPD